MTRRIVSHALTVRTWSRSHVSRRELLAHVTHAPTEVRGFFCKVLIIREQMLVRRQHRTTAASIRNDRRIRIKSCDVLPRKLACPLEIAGVRVQRTAANLPGWRLNRELV